MTLLFDKYPTLSYDLSGNGTASDIVTNIFVRYGVTSETKTNAFYLYEYLIGDHDTPDILASKIYGNSEYHWVILWLNDIANPLFDWPRNSSDFANYITSRYGSVPLAQTTIHHYTKTISRYAPANGTTNTVVLEVDFSTYNTLADYAYQDIVLNSGTDVQVTTTRQAVTCYDWENLLNENKRHIKILKAEYLPVIVSEFEQLLKTYGIKPNTFKRTVR